MRRYPGCDVLEVLFVGILGAVLDSEGCLLTGCFVEVSISLDVYAKTGVGIWFELS